MGLRRVAGTRHPLEPGTLATVVTTLERRAPLPLPGGGPPSPLSLHRWHTPSLEDYRALFRRVGEPWLWFSRLVQPDAAVRAVLADERVHVFVARLPDGAAAGLIELDHRRPGECQLHFVGLVPELAGHGHGRWLIAEALRLAGRPGVGRVWLDTCTLDHPAALPAYRRAGFRAVAREVQVFADPRLTGHLPRSSAPQIPIVE